MQHLFVPHSQSDAVLQFNSMKEWLGHIPTKFLHLIFRNNFTRFRWSDRVHEYIQPIVPQSIRIQIEKSNCCNEVSSVWNVIQLDAVQPIQLNA